MLSLYLFKILHLSYQEIIFDKDLSSFFFQTRLHSIEISKISPTFLWSFTFPHEIPISTQRQYAYHKYSALCLLRVFIEYFKRISRRVNLQIRSHKVKNSLTTLHFLLRLRYGILKRWDVDFSKYLNKHSNRYSVLDYQIRLFSMTLIDSNSRIESYESKSNHFLSFIQNS